MSTKARKKAAHRGRQAAPADQLRDIIGSIRDAVQTKSGRSFLTVIQFQVSLLTLLYFKGVVRMAYNSMFYRLEIPQDHRGIYCFLVTVVCIFFGAVMLFTRRQIITRLVIMLSMIFYLPIILFNYRYTVLLVPLTILIAVTYLASGTKEGPKTIFGAVFIMIYILGTFVFLTVQSILQPATEEKVIERGVTENGQYRYSIVQVLDQGDGNTYVSVEPNTADIEYKHCKWYAKGFAKEVYHERPLDKFDAQWQIQSRSEITRELIAHNPNTTFTLDAEQMKLLGLNVGYAEDVNVSSLSRKQRHALGYGWDDDPIDSRLAKFFRVTLVDDEYTVSLDFDKMVEIGLHPTCDLRLSRMSDDNLAALGVPEENAVLTVGEKPVFREYVAMLERTFDPSNRELTAFLEPNVLPPVDEEGFDLDAIRSEREAAYAEKYGTDEEDDKKTTKKADKKNTGNESRTETTAP
ncbi:MAG: oligosaccharide repeat unit polymerase [Oscillospiraceae bacterium]|nr:oligosaccharide repeat unit polymerase [Oscillospiraceae bacterium]